MKKIYKYICLIAIVSLLSCNNSENKKVFNPQKDSSSSSGDNSEQIAKKRAEFLASQATTIQQQLIQFDGKVKLTVMIPNDQGFSESEMKQLESKLIQMSTTNGIGGLGGNPRFIIAPIVNITKKDVTSSAPAKYSIKFDVMIYVADILTGNVYGSYNMKFSSVESSQARAFTSGFDALNTSDAGLQTFLKSSQEKIIKYYNDNGDKIIAEANSLSSQMKYAEAITLLESIPMEADIPFNKAAKITPLIFQKYLDNECENTIAMMKASFGTYNEQSAAGFNAEAMGYYKLIPSGGKCAKEANQIYNSYKKGLKPQAIKDWEKAEKEWKFKLSQQTSDNQFRTLQEELKAKVSIEGQKKLLEKYKQDLAYEKLPWLRKLIHVGNKDPFDSYDPEK
ncbi:MAG: hypothetical protein WCK02_00245 [Bacteroidota bacterium]